MIPQLPYQPSFSTLSAPKPSFRNTKDGGEGQKTDLGLSPCFQQCKSVLFSLVDHFFRFFLPTSPSTCSTCSTLITSILPRWQTEFFIRDLTLAPLLSSLLPRSFRSTFLLLPSTTLITRNDFILDFLFTFFEIGSSSCFFFCFSCCFFLCPFTSFFLCCSSCCCYFFRFGS